MTYSCRIYRKLASFLFLAHILAVSCFNPIFQKEAQKPANTFDNLRSSILPLAIGIVTCASVEPVFAEVPGWVEPTRAVVDPFLLYMEFAFLCRVVLSWYPQIDLNKAPQNLVSWPTEPILKPTRAIVPPAFGVDVSPIVWIMLLSFAREVLFGQQGIFNMMLTQME